MTPPRIALFALTGFGNTVLSSLCAEGLKPQLLITRAESGPFPYYDESPLIELAQRLHVPYLYGAEGEEKVAAEPPDIALCATYHRMLRAPLLANVRWAINLHPSLLPKYRGPNPFYWVLRNQERQTGVTAHMMTEAADAGPILLQESILISPTETQGSLRQRLASVAAAIGIETIRRVQNGTISPMTQDKSKATSFDRPTDADRRLPIDWDVDQSDRLIRALAPFPGAIIDAGIVSGVVQRESASTGPPGSAVPLGQGLYRLRLCDGDLVVRLATAKPFS